MSIELIRRGVFPSAARAPLALSMLIMVMVLVSGLLAMHVLFASMGMHGADHLSGSGSCSGMVTGESSPAEINSLVKVHAALAHDMPDTTAMPTECSNECLPIHSMGASSCVLTVSAPILLFAAALPAPARSIDTVAGVGLAFANGSLSKPKPPDLKVLSVSRT